MLTREKFWRNYLKSDTILSNQGYYIGAGYPYSSWGTAGQVVALPRWFWCWPNRHQQHTLKRAGIILLCMNKSTTCKASEIILLLLLVLETALQKEKKKGAKWKESWGNQNQQKPRKCNSMVCSQRRKAQGGTWEHFSITQHCCKDTENNLFSMI